MPQEPVSLDESKLSSLRGAIDAALERFTAEEAGSPSRLTAAIRYSCLAPGKRLRPLLSLLACETLCGDWQPAIPAACAAEMIHVYSLIHDDLPAMDNDDLRRGLPTCHKQFDEATAILAGDSLQMLAINVLCNHMPTHQVADCCRILSQAAGRAHLVGGQMDDLAGEGRFGQVAHATTGLEHLQNIHRRKTGALIVASLQLGGVAADASAGQLDTLEQYGQAIGLAFQIVDDCLDVESTPEQMGKQTRKDSDLGKLTYPGLLGLAESKQMARNLIEDAIETIRSLGGETTGLVELARFVISRNR